MILTENITVSPLGNNNRRYSLCEYKAGTEVEFYKEHNFRKNWLWVLIPYSSYSLLGETSTNKALVMVHKKSLLGWNRI